jgi:hypothetical protein
MRAGDSRGEQAITIPVYQEAATCELTAGYNSPRTFDFGDAEGNVAAG